MKTTKKVKNIGDENTGFFNTSSPEIINVFNRPCKMEDWQNAIKPAFISNLKFNEWILFDDMTSAEKIQHEKASVTEPYLRTISYKDAWKTAYDRASKRDIWLLKGLPNWDAKVFEDITSIKV